MDRTPFDVFAKDLAADALSPAGRAETDVRLAPDPQFADVCFEPTAPSPPPSRELLHRLTSEGPTMLEFARQAPDVLEVGTWLAKQLAWWRRFAADARSDKRPPPKAPPYFWGLSAGKPNEAMAAFRHEPMDVRVWPSGCYAAPPGGRFRLVVISELPRTPDTLLVRLMGAGVTFREALEDFDALPADDPVRRLVWPHLVRLQLEVHNPQDTEPSMVSETHRIYNEWLETQQRIGMERGLAQGIKKGREEGLEAGLRPLLRLFERRLARALTGAEHTALVARLTALGPDRLGDVVLDLDPPALAAWLADPDAR
jgi:hypothetical protein